MKSSLKIALQYIISLGLAVLLLWYIFSIIHPEEIIDKVKEANPIYILISFFLLTISHISRAIRWQILFRPLGYQPTTLRAFLALMSGYFVNGLVPRLGEVTRCGVLQKIERIPVTVSFGTVITERLVDLLMLVILFIFTFFIEFDRLNQFFMSLFSEKFQTATSLSTFFFIAIVAVILMTISVFLIYRILKEKLHQNKLFSKFFNFGKSIMDGVLSIRKIKEIKSFIFHTIIIWTMYYAASFIVVYSLPQTSHLSALAGFSILLMGSIGMTAPVQGGIGTFHYFVSSVLVLYGISKEDGLAFAFLTHTSQYVFTLITGGLCFLATFFINNKKEISTCEYSR